MQSNLDPMEKKLDNPEQQPATESKTASPGMMNEWAKMTQEEVGEKFFQWRDYTPLPLIALMFVVAHPSAVSATFGLLVITAGELIRVYAVSFIGGVSRTRTRSTNQSLITDGAFSIVRNPLYVGNFLITTGAAVYSGVPWMVVLAAIAFYFQYHYIVLYEESLLKAKFGAEYSEYCKRVPRWWPAKMPEFDKLPWPETFAPALKSEKRTLLAILCVVLLLMIRRL
jgi:protein-S-isoprenylcysteine O-methyltransferase Ste14